MLLLDDDDHLPTSPDPGEAKLSVELGEQGLRAIDAALLSHVEPSWLKVARVVHDALGAGGTPIADDVVRLHVRRVAALVEVGVLEARGNLRRPRFSEVRLPQR
jgi:uncharacterized protein DUF3658